MRKIIGIILSPIHYIAFGLILVIFQPIQWICYKLFGYKAHKYSVDILNFFLTSSYYLLGNRVSWTNRQPLPLNRPMIFVANHQSMYDIPPMIWRLSKYHAKFISKIELTKNIPSISYNLKVGGGANIDRKDQRQSITELMKLGQRMKENNWSTVIFPEGTRSKDGNIKFFRAAGIATILKKCPDALLVPIAVENSWKMVQYGAFPLSTFEHLKFTVLNPIEPKAAANVDEAVLQCENEIRKFLGQPENLESRDKAQETRA
ncbi:lysophospholipid acyltransferase family protein [Mucilaginibacter sp. KACC 22063]|uniref:lysophospholipid acyltransferase family protein n=1 Tax=Mucilaginibacter sp. KACC 22063 TaxID=3025666 RepID=UPI0023658D27|nr:lysophospholipid acyltransferase family protein [Mucilaginibacter sp. KACC 22063]WDF55146.1 lysophospholipid acyltransferase family protein [Mucilaginibacter sp. KACC 22063]